MRREGGRCRLLLGVVEMVVVGGRWEGVSMHGSVPVRIRGGDLRVR